MYNLFSLKLTVYDLGLGIAIGDCKPLFPKDGNRPNHIL